MESLKNTLKFLRHFSLLVILPGVFSLLLSACASSTTTTNLRGRPEPPKGFFDRLADAITERECNVMRFTCPYGFGPAGEPCECTDPKGVVLKGHTVKLGEN
jgi:hypothetical protein